MQFHPTVTDQHTVLCMQAPALEGTGETDASALREIMVSQATKRGSQDSVWLMLMKRGN